MSEADRLTRITIKRFLPERDGGSFWQPYEVETAPGMTVLDALQQIRERLDATLAWRYSCRMGICGSCAMIINGTPALACNTQVQAISKTRIKLEPLWNLAVVKDLVTDLVTLFDHHKRVKPFIIRSDAGAPMTAATEFKQTPDELLDYLQFSYCIKCGACVAACPTVAIDPQFSGPMPLAAAHRYNADSRDDGFSQRKTAVNKGHGAAHCHYAGECSRVCPKGVDPARAIQLLRRDLIKDLFGVRKREPAARMEEPQVPPQRLAQRPRAPEYTVPQASRDSSATE